MCTGVVESLDKDGDPAQQHENQQGLWCVCRVEPQAVGVGIARDQQRALRRIESAGDLRGAGCHVVAVAGLCSALPLPLHLVVASMCALHLLDCGHDGGCLHVVALLSIFDAWHVGHPLLDGGHEGGCLNVVALYSTVAEAI